MHNIFIDGSAGTTGLELANRLKLRDDVRILEISDADRKNAEARKRLINQSDLTFLCLPDDAAREAVALVDNERTKIIDASTAHRTVEGWAYGLPELSDAHFEAIRRGNRIAVPGCHAGGFVALVYPLIKSGLVSADYPFICFSLTGYSGGGKAMIAQYGQAEADSEYSAPRQYGLAQNHKHLKEMTAVPGLTRPPIFCPVVSNYYRGMEVTVPLVSAFAGGITLAGVREVFKEHYRRAKLISVKNEDTAFLAANKLKNKNNLEIYIFGNDDRIILTAVFDNLGKGASGAAVQCMNIALGMDETTGLI